MRTGRLKYRVSLQEPSETRDAKGQPIKTWVTAGTVWAGIESLRRKEDENQVGYQDIGYRFVRVVLRRRDDVTHDWRVTHGSRTLEVDGPPSYDHYGTKGYMYLTCKEII